MDRRDFLKTTSAAAVAVGAASAPAGALDLGQAPAILSGARELTLSSLRAGPPGEGSDRLARRIETATDGRYRIVAWTHGAHPDLSYGTAYHYESPHRAFAFFAGLPFSQGVDASALQTWLAVGGGAMLWDELAAEHGFKPLVAGHTGPGVGVWATSRLETSRDLAGATLHAEGLAGDVLRALGAVPAEFSPNELHAALADGQLQAAEFLGPFAAVTHDLQPPAQRLYQPGFNRNGLVLSLNVSRPLWDSMSTADRAIFEGCAAQEYQLSLADAAAHALIAAQVQVPAKWPVRQAWSAELRATLERAAAEALEAIAAIDPASRRIHDSYRAFRRMLGEAAAA
jgi:TRAP-type mannitol/chloroaromatic compound transport system substrate-binding protein